MCSGSRTVSPGGDGFAFSDQIRGQRISRRGDLHHGNEAVPVTGQKKLYETMK